MKNSDEICRVEAHNDARGLNRKIVEKIAEATDEHFRNV